MDFKDMIQSNMSSSKIEITQVPIHKDNEYELCFDCGNPIIVDKFSCNCGCEECYCQRCFLKHYKNFAVDITLQRFRNKKPQWETERETNGIRILL